MIKTFDRDHYGEQFMWFLGKVISNSDPEQLGRVQVRIYGIHSQDQTMLPDKHLPWAQCLIPSTEGGISGIGQHSSILPGALVFGFFMDGESCQIPFVMGSIHHKEIKLSNPSEPTDLGNRRDERDPRGRDQIPGTQTQNPKGQPTSKIDTSLEGNSNAEKIFNFFTKQGLTPAQAAGMVGNFFAESSLDPTKLNPNDKGLPSEGLAQWRGDRQAQLKSFAASQGLDYRSMTAQLNFVMHEFATTESRAFGKLKEASTPKEAAIAVSRYYERPENKIVNGEYTSPSLNTRIDVATDAYRRFAR